MRAFHILAEPEQVAPTFLVGNLMDDYRGWFVSTYVHEAYRLRQQNPGRSVFLQMTLQDEADFIVNATPDVIGRPIAAMVQRGEVRSIDNLFGFQVRWGFTYARDRAVLDWD